MIENSSGLRFFNKKQKKEDHLFKFRRRKSLEFLSEKIVDEFDHVLTDEEERERVVLMIDSGRILIMDDEESIRDVAGEMLRYLGYQVDTAVDGAEALSLYKKAKAIGRSYDLVITDLTVPEGMGGVEVIQKLREIDSEAKVIVSSGYSNDPVMSEYKTYGFQGVMRKPYTIHDLNQTLQQVMIGQE